MSGRIIYCENGCKDAGNRRQTEPPAHICRTCERDIRKWLRDIPDKYSLLWMFVEHGSAAPNPDSKATKRAEAPAPMRLEIIDLLDTRLGRRWNGTAPAHDRRGVVGTIRVHVERLVEERRLTTPRDDTSVTQACDILAKHVIWLTEQEDWIKYLYEDLKSLNRAISDGIGEYRRPPVGHCHVIPEDSDKPCGGPLFANHSGGVHCAKCRAEWDAAHLRQLGLAQAQAANA